MQQRGQFPDRPVVQTQNSLAHGRGPVLGHGGEVDGHSACMAFVPGLDIGLVVLSNLGGDSAEVLSMALMRGVLPRLLQTAR